MMSESTEGITQPWASLSEVGNSKEIDRNQLAITMIQTLHAALNDGELKGMAEFVDRRNHLDNFIKRPIKLIMRPRDYWYCARHQ